MFSDKPASLIMASHKTEVEEKSDAGKLPLTFSSGATMVSFSSGIFLFLPQGLSFYPF